MFNVWLLAFSLLFFLSILAWKISRWSGIPNAPMMSLNDFFLLSL